jgi:hypothetical protein
MVKPRNQISEVESIKRVVVVQATVDPPAMETSRILMPLVDNRLKAATISRVAATIVALISPSIKYRDFGITAIGHREQTELVA